LNLSGWTFETRSADIDETPLAGETPEAFVVRLSRDKARAVAASMGGEADAVVIACDTTVVLDGELLNKPADAAGATTMLRRLRGRTHQVLTALTLLAAGVLETEVVTSPVPMRDYSEDEIASYVASGDPLDKAGAYAIQHPGFQPVARGAFTHCFANVMGLPLCHLLRRLSALGFDSPGLPQRCQAFIPYDCPIWGDVLR
jgi:MAF protein